MVHTACNAAAELRELLVDMDEFRLNKEAKMRDTVLALGRHRVGSPVGMVRRPRSSVNDMRLMRELGAVISALASTSVPDRQSTGPGNDAVIHQTSTFPSVSSTRPSSGAISPLSSLRAISSSATPDRMPSTPIQDTKYSSLYDQNALDSGIGQNLKCMSVEPKPAPNARLTRALLSHNTKSTCLNSDPPTPACLGPKERAIARSWEK